MKDTVQFFKLYYLLEMEMLEERSISQNKTKYYLKEQVCQVLCANDGRAALR